MIGDTPLIQTSMLKQEGIDELEIQIRDLFFGGDVQNQDMTCMYTRAIFHYLNKRDNQSKMRLMQPNQVYQWIWYKSI